MKVNRTRFVLGAFVFIAFLWLCSSFLQNITYIPDPALIPTIERLMQQPQSTPIFIWRHGINPKPGSIIGRWQRIDVVLAPQALLKPGEVEQPGQLQGDLLRTTRILINEHEFSSKDIHFTLLNIAQMLPNSVITGVLLLCFKPDLPPGANLIEVRISRTDMPQEQSYQWTYQVDYRVAAENDDCPRGYNK